MQERIAAKLGAAIELTKKRLLAANPEYAEDFDIFNFIRISKNLKYYGELALPDTIILNERYLELNDISTISRLLIHEFIHAYIFKRDRTLLAHGEKFQKLVHEVYEANNLKTRESYTKSTGNMLEANAVCQHCGAEYHWSQARLARYKAGAKFYCHECYEKEHKYYWLKSLDDIVDNQLRENSK
ncbi:MAG: SprT-like domain-containing protein [Candidatus Micrarchaeaceae archaeon]